MVRSHFLPLFLSTYLSIYSYGCFYYVLFRRRLEMEVFLDVLQITIGFLGLFGWEKKWGVEKNL